MAQMTLKYSLFMFEILSLLTLGIIYCILIISMINFRFKIKFLWQIYFLFLKCHDDRFVMISKFVLEVIEHPFCKKL